MNDERPDDDVELRRELEDLREKVAANRADIDSLLSRADDANHRADASKARADAAEKRTDVIEGRADAAHRRADASEARSADDRRRISDLETHVDVDRAMIFELQAEGLLSERHARELEEALHTSRRIGAAIGIVIAHRKVSEADAFLLLARQSQNTNRKVRDIADEIVRAGERGEPPDF
jgi:chromosome segregation ATPase